MVKSFKDIDNIHALTTRKQRDSSTFIYMGWKCKCAKNWITDMHLQQGNNRILAFSYMGGKCKCAKKSITCMHLQHGNDKIHGMKVQVCR